MRRSSHHRPVGTGAPAGPESGVSLMFALVFLILISTLITGVLTYAFSANRNVQSFRRDRALHFATDGALEVGVDMVQANPTMGFTLFPACGLDFPLDAHNAEGVFAAGAHLTVDCLPTPNLLTPIPPSPGGNQPYRDVTFEVTCRLPASYTPPDPLACGTGPDVMFLGRARVRYDIDPGHTPRTAWAIVPKVVSWEISR